MHRDYLYGKLSDYHFIRLHVTTIFDGITTISFWWRLKVLDNKFCPGFNSSCSGIFTFNGFNGPFQPELSERRVPCRHVTIMDLHSHILEIQLMPCHTFVLIKTYIVTSEGTARFNRNCLRGGYRSGTFLHLCHVAASREVAAFCRGWVQQGIGVGANIPVGNWPRWYARNVQGCGVGSAVELQVANSARTAWSVAGISRFWAYKGGKLFDRKL